MNPANIAQNPVIQFFAWLNPIVISWIPLLYTLWLFQIWRRKRETCYIWLMAGLGLVPFFSTILRLIFTHFFVAAVASGNKIALGYVTTFSSGMFGIISYGCILMALANFAGGEVGFWDLFRRARGPEDEDLNEAG